MKKVWPPLVLVLLAPVIGELLSGATYPSRFFSPPGIVVLTILYGGGALLVREMTIRWGKGWWSLLLLGAAYGIIEEGLMAKSFFDPLWQDVGVLGYYGRWAGVSWIWSFELTLYHAFISIAIPILLAELIFPARRREKWLPNWALALVAVYFTANVIFGNIFLTEYQPGIPHYLVTLAVIAGLVLLAWRLPRRPFPARDISVRGPWLFWLLGFLAMAAFMVIFWVFPDFNVLPLVPGVMGLMLVSGGGWLVMRLSGNGAAWSDVHKLALAAGPLSIYILMTPIQEFASGRPGEAAGMTFVGIGMAIFLIWLFRQTYKQTGIPGRG
jgi:hypothetical protein